MNYKQQAHKPSWYESDDSKIYHKVTSGSSPFNEWYEFDNRKDALDHVALCFYSDSFWQRFSFHNGEIYDDYQFTFESINSAASGDDWILKLDAKPACIQEMIEAESRF